MVGNDLILPLTLRDDGRHGDAGAGDGVYGAYFTRATAAGSYQLLIQGQHGSATRQARAAFHVLADADDDGDGMPTAWEKRYGLDYKANDADQDADRDYLTNLAEYRAGTSPVDDDTDDGGESDDTDASHGDAVNNPDDDAIDTITLQSRVGAHSNRLHVIVVGAAWLG